MNETRLVLVGALLSAGACTAPPPPGAPLPLSAVVGDWRAEGVRLDIAEDGTVHYEKVRNGKIDLDGMKLSNLTTTGFDVGAMGLSTHFVIDAVPAVVDGETRMTVDGIVLVRRVEKPVEVPEERPAPPPSSLPAPGTLEALVGTWVGDDMRLRIEPDGTLHYRRGEKFMDGMRVHDVTATSFQAGVLGIDTTFRIDAPAALVDGKVVMTVDGVALTKMVP